MLDLKGKTIVNATLDIKEYTHVDLSNSRLIDVQIVSNQRISNLIMKSAFLKNVFFSYSQTGLVNLKIENIILNHATFEGTDFSNIDFLGENYFLNSIFKNVDFSDSVLGKSDFFDLSQSRFTGCIFKNTQIENCCLKACLFWNSDLRDVSFRGSNLSDIAFKDCIINSNTMFDDMITIEKNSDYETAYHAYVELKNLFKEKGYENLSQRYYERERISRAKMQKRDDGKPKKRRRLVWVQLDKLGKKPFNIFILMVVVILACTFFYFLGGICPSGATSESSIHNFADSLYYSVVTFTTLGYGDFLPAEGLSRVVAIIEALAGPFLLGWFVSALIRKAMED